MICSTLDSIIFFSLFFFIKSTALILSLDNITIYCITLGIFIFLYFSIHFDRLLIWLVQLPVTPAM